MTLVLSPEEIARGVRRLAQEIDHYYLGKRPLLVGVLRGAFIFLSDLVRLLEIPVTVDFIRLPSYGCGTESQGAVRVLQGLSEEIRGRDVIVVEDIVDTGVTTTFLMAYLKRRKPASLRLCVLLDKPSRHRVEVPIDYLGFLVPNVFLVGYGLDLAQAHRQYPAVYALEEEVGP